MIITQPEPRFKLLWHKHKYKLSGLLLLLPIWFLYLSLTPSFPPLWPSKQLGEFSIAPMPLNFAKPYVHHDDYVKDFMLIFEQGDISNIRQGYVNIGPKALSVEDFLAGENGILHGNKHGQHAHAIAAKTLTSNDRLWVSLQNWQGEWHVAQWTLPNELLTQ